MGRKRSDRIGLSKNWSRNWVHSSHQPPGTALPLAAGREGKPLAANAFQAAFASRPLVLDPPTRGRKTFGFFGGKKPRARRVPSNEDVGFAFKTQQDATLVKLGGKETGPFHYASMAMSTRLVIRFLLLAWGWKSLKRGFSNGNILFD